MLFFRKKVPAQLHSCSEQWKEGGRDGKPLDLFGLRPPTDVEIQKAITAKLFEDGTHSIFPKCESTVPNQIGYAWRISFHFRNGDCPVRILESGGPCNDGINNAEYRRVGADAEREHENCGASEAGISPQHMKTMTKILQKLIEHERARSEHNSKRAGNSRNEHYCLRRNFLHM